MNRLEKRIDKLEFGDRPKPRKRSPFIELLKLVNEHRTEDGDQGENANQEEVDKAFEEKRIRLLREAFPNVETGE